MVKSLLAIIALSLSVLGCGDDVSPTAATTSTPAADLTAVLVVRLDLASCVVPGRILVPSAAVSIDGVSAGTLTPGGGDIARHVTLGEHTITASGGGRIWATVIVRVLAGGSVYVLYC